MPNETVIEEKQHHTGPQKVDPNGWVELYADYLYAYALSRLNDEEKARDMVQDTFLSALECVANFRGESNERTWLTAIMKYKIIDFYRKKSNVLLRISEYPTPAEEGFFDPQLNNWKREHWPEPFGVEDQDPIHHKEFLGVLQHCLRKLPSLWLSVFTMKHMDEERTEKICTELHISTSNYWVIMHRAKVNLRSCVQKNWLS
jgi:RNA polymerase sigma-70 factor (TIGR02943 family)